MYDLTVIIPTYNEELNISDIIYKINNILTSNHINGEILIVDDNSPDNTVSIVNNIKINNPNVNFIVRTSDRGLSQSVVEGFKHANSPIVIVTDADGSHQLSLIPLMYCNIKFHSNDIVIGSRYIEGGIIKKWPLKRRIISIGATLLGRLLFPSITDPVSGFFAIRKDIVENAPLTPRGYKILMEILGKTKWDMCIEIPYEFIDRSIGSSKLKSKTIIEYIQQVINIAIFKVSKQ